MKMALFVHTFFALCMYLPSYLCNPCKNYENVIIISKELNVTDIEQCWSSKLDNTVHCNSLSKTLQKNTKNNTCVLVMTDLILNQSCTWHNIHRLKITSNSTNVPTITCDSSNIPGLGFTFEDSSDISISNLNISGCGRKHSINSDFSVMSALFVQQGSNVTIDNVVVSNSSGHGIILVDVNDVITLNQVSVMWSKAIPIQMNGTSKPQYASGGGIYIEYSKTYAGHSNKVFLSCKLVMNHAQELINNTVPDHFPYGKGGGVTVLISGKLRYGEFFIDGESIFDTNMAAWGGAVYIYLSQFAQHNKFNFNNVSFFRNVANHTGGAVYIVQSAINSNNVTFTNSHFFDNKAFHGGGMSIVTMNLDNWNNAASNLQIHGASTDDALGRVLINGCNFMRNKARLGSALHLQRMKADFVNLSIAEGKSLPGFEKLGKGSIYTYDSILHFNGRSKLTKNDDTAIMLDCSDLLVNGTLHLTHNNGYDGGALALYGHSHIKLSSTSDLSFLQNFASNRGGAIFVMIPGPPLRPWQTTELQLYSCFFLFTESIDGSPTNFTGYVRFSHNRAFDDYGNDIYASSIQYCRQPSHMKLSDVITNWTNFEFIPKNKPRSVLTQAINIILKNNDWNNILPGQAFKATVFLIDERDNFVQGTVNVQPTNNVSVETNAAFAVNNSTITMSLIGEERTSYNVTVTATGGIPISKHSNFNQLGHCSFGYIFNDGKCLCDLHNNMMNGIAECSPTQLFLFPNRWVPPIWENSTTNVLSVVCPSGYCSECVANESAVYCVYQKTKQCHSSRNESSLLCSECKMNLSIPVGGETCIKCENTKNWIWVTIVIMFGLFFFVSLVLFFDLNIMSFYINGALYSYQIIDILYAPGQDNDKFLQFMISIAEFTTKNTAYPSLCLWDGMNNLQKMAYNYIIPVSMLVSMSCFYFYARCKQRAYMTTDRCLRTFTIVAVMVYSDVMRISFWLLNPVVINEKKHLYIYAKVEYLSSYHMPYALAAMFILALFVIGPVLLFFLTPLLNNRKYGRLSVPFSYFQTVITSYNYCLKDGYLWFPGFYLLCRLFIFSIGVFLQSGPLKFVILSVFCLVVCAIVSMILPYKIEAFNTVETFLLANVGIVAILSLGTESVYIKKEIDVFKRVINVISYIPMAVVLCAILYSLMKKVLRGLHKRRQILGNSYAPVPRRSVMDINDDPDYYAFED